MRGSTGTSMQGSFRIKKPNKIKSNCLKCGWCKKYDKASDGIICGRWQEAKYGDEWRKRRFCSYFFTFGESNGKPKKAKRRGRHII